MPDDPLRDKTSTDRFPAEDGGRAELVPAAHDNHAGLTLRGVAAGLGVSVSTVRAHVKTGRLAASQVTGRHGPEYRVCPAVVPAFAAEYLELEAAAGGANGSRGSAGVSMSDDVRDLRARLQVATEEAARYKALNVAAAERYREELTRLQNERDAALVRANEATADLEHLRHSGLLGRLLGR